MQLEGVFSDLKTQKPPSLRVCRDEGLTRFVVPPCFGVERPSGHSPPFVLPVTGARRNPLLSFHGFGSEASSAGARLARTNRQFSLFRMLYPMTVFNILFCCPRPLPTTPRHCPTILLR